MLSLKTKKDFNVSEFILNYALYFILIALVLIIIIKEPGFLSILNFRQIMAQSSSRIIIALGIGGILIAQSNDLSAGRQVGLAAVISASLLQSLDYASRMYPNLPELPLVPVILLCVAIGAVIGLINGFIVAVLKVTPFIATLGMQLIIYGINFIYVDRPPLGAQPIGGLSEKFMKYAQGSFFTGKPYQLPYIVIYAVIVSFVIWILWNKTRFGKNMYAVGGNPEAAIVSGVNVVKSTILVHVLGSMLFALGGTLEAARSGTANGNTGNGYELDAIAACIVGGLSFSGGIGTVPGVIIGVILFQVINYGLNFISVSIYYQYIVRGLIIVIAVAIDTRKTLKKK